MIEQVITFYDPDGLEIELVAHKDAEEKKIMFGERALFLRIMLLEDFIQQPFLGRI